MISSPTRMIGIGLGAGLLIIIFGISLLGITDQERLLPNLWIGELNLGGLDRPRATQAVAVASRSAATLEVRIDETTLSSPLADFGLALDVSATIDSLFAISARANVLRTGWYRIVSWFRPLPRLAVIQRDREKFAQQIENIGRTVQIDEQDARLEFDQGSWQIVPSQPGRSVDQDQLAAAILDRVSRLSTAPVVLQTYSIEPLVTSADVSQIQSVAYARTREPILLTVDSEVLSIEPQQLAVWIEVMASPHDRANPVNVRLNQSKVRSYIETLANRYNRQPSDARVVFSGDEVKITKESIDGRLLDEEALLRALVTAFASSGIRQVALPFVVKLPAVSSATLATLGLKELIGTATTSYAGSPDNRKHNIANGGKYLTGQLIEPGAEFSVVKALGSVDDTTGYLPELVIKEDRTVPEFGGGLCQVSTTLFRAALNAGLKITQRQNHSYRVSYYERGVGPGLDATIYLPSPDLKFLNDTPGWILVQGNIDETAATITFDLYGTKDGRTSQISSPEISDITNPSAPIYVETPDLPRGETKQLEKAHQGAKTVVTYQVSRADATILEQTFRSTYKAWPARYLVGTGEPSPSETEPVIEGAP